MNINPTIVWLILGVILIGLEITAAPGFFFFLALGIASLIVGILVASGWVVTWAGGFVIFALLSVASIFPLRVLAKRIREKHPRLSGVDAFIGQEAVVINFLGSSERPTSYLIEVSREHWSAKTKSSDVALAIGERVRVVSVEGVHLIVEKIGGN